jgi:translation initiation factor 2-alpha kinase 3
LSLRYQALSAQLARVGLTAAGLDQDKHQAIRQQYRDGLDVFSKANAGSSTARLRPSRRRMLTGVQDSPSDPEAVNFDNLRIGPTPSLPLTLGPYVAQPPLFGTRYTQDFEELGILGKGGYGIVYQCRHKLDGVIYAVKKVPVSERRRQQILIRGQPEVDDLLSELRTLAQLDHPNIVRYFNGWLDYMNLGNSLDESSGSVTGAEDSRTGSFSRGRIIAEASEDHIMFENSVSLLPSPPWHISHIVHLWVLDVIPWDSLWCYR